MADVKEVIAKVVPSRYSEGGKPKSLSSYKMTYDANTNQIEPVYYWILDFMQDAGIKVEKITDNFMASPGSGQFSEMGQKATQMQQQASKILGDTNVVIKSILNIIYDLKEFEIRLKHYERAKSKEKKEMEEGMLALKNIWLDQVDLKRGRGSIHQMSAELGYTTVREFFLAANSTKELEQLTSQGGGVNEMLRKVLLPRLSEFLIWKDESEKELTKRFNIEKAYLKSQVESLKLYTQWARPYLKAAKELTMKGFNNNPALVGAFSTSMFELSLMGLRKAKGPPEKFSDYKLQRDYFEVFVISLNYRGHLGQRVTQKGDYAYGVGGRVDMTFDCYALNSDEMKLIREGLKEADLDDGLKLVQDNTEEALQQLKEDIIKYTSDNPLKEEKKKEEKKDYDDTNPFTALFGGIWDLFTKGLQKKDKKIEIKKPEDIPKDNFVEESVREKVSEDAKGMLYAIYDVYKKAHGMASSPENFDN